MSKTNTKTTSTRTVTLLLIGVMCIPLLSQIFINGRGVHTADLVTLFQSDIEAIRQRALENRTTVIMQKRAYTRAMERCRDRLADGEQVTCPTINDPSSYLPEATHAAPSAVEPVEEEAKKPLPVSDIRDISTQQRRILRTYTRAGFCSKAAGILLYNLCMSMIGDTVEYRSPVGIQNENIKLHTKHSAGPASIKLRLQMMDEAISGSKGRRDELTRPLRYQGGLNQ